MTFDETMQALMAAGTAQHRKVYTRHGAREPMFGVSYANLYALQKKIKTDQTLADRLWDSGNHDARVLALLVADPANGTAAWAKKRVKDIDNYVLSDALARMLNGSPAAPKLIGVWTASKKEWPATTGWALLASRALDEASELSDAACGTFIAQIEKRIHAAPNRVRHSMNLALIALGVRNSKLTKRALVAAKKIGKVEVDHGETGCKTPDAAAYIHKTLDHRKKKAANKTSRKKVARKKPASKKAALRPRR